MRRLLTGESAPATRPGTLPASMASVTPGPSDVADTKEGMTAGTAPGGHAPPAEDPLREAAERGLRALAGPQARLRADQWTAIRALVADRRRALVVQRTK